MVHSRKADAFTFKAAGPKHHYAEHIRMDMAECVINPKYQTCFGEEDLLGKLKKIGSKTHRRVASTRLVQRYLLYVALRWSDRKRIGRWTAR